MRRTALRLSLIVLRHSLFALRLSVSAMLLASVVMAQQKTMAAATSAAIALDPNKLVAITGGKLLTITRGTIDNGVLIIENGKMRQQALPIRSKFRLTHRSSMPGE